VLDTIAVHCVNKLNKFIIERCRQNIDDFVIRFSSDRENHHMGFENNTG